MIQLKLINLCQAPLFSSNYRIWVGNEIDIFWSLSRIVLAQNTLTYLIHVLTCEASIGGIHFTLELAPRSPRNW